MNEIETLEDINELDEVFKNTCIKLLDKNIRIYNCIKKDNFLVINIYKNSLSDDNINIINNYSPFGIVKERRVDNNNIYTILVPYNKDNTIEEVDDKFKVVVDHLQDQDILYGNVDVDNFYNYCYIELLENKIKREFVLKNMFITDYVICMYNKYLNKGLIYDNKIYFKKIYLDKHKKYINSKTLNK